MTGFYIAWLLLVTWSGISCRPATVQPDTAVFTETAFKNTTENSNKSSIFETTLAASSELDDNFDTFEDYLLTSTDDAIKSDYEFVDSLEGDDLNMVQDQTTSLPIIGEDKYVISVKDIFGDQAVEGERGVEVLRDWLMHENDEVTTNLIENGIEENDLNGKETTGEVVETTVMAEIDLTTQKITENDLTTPKTVENDLTAIKSTDLIAPENDLTTARISENDLITPKPSENDITTLKTKENDLTAPNTIENDVATTTISENNVTTPKTTGNDLTTQIPADSDIRASNLTETLTSGDKDTNVVDEHQTDNNDATKTIETIGAENSDSTEPPKNVADDDLKTLEDIYDSDLQRNLTIKELISEAVDEVYGTAYSQQKTDIGGGEIENDPDLTEKLTTLVDPTTPHEDETTGTHKMSSVTDKTDVNNNSSLTTQESEILYNLTGQVTVKPIILNEVREVLETIKEEQKAEEEEDKAAEEVDNAKSTKINAVEKLELAMDRALKTGLVRSKSLEEEERVLEEAERATAESKGVIEEAEKVVAETNKVIEEAQKAMEREDSAVEEVKKLLEEEKEAKLEENKAIERKEKAVEEVDMALEEEEKAIDAVEKVIAEVNAFEDEESTTFDTETMVKDLQQLIYNERNDVVTETYVVETLKGNEETTTVRDNKSVDENVGALEEEDKQVDSVAKNNVLQVEGEEIDATLVKEVEKAIDATDNVLENEETVIDEVPNSNALENEKTVDTHNSENPNQAVQNITNEASDIVTKSLDEEDKNLLQVTTNLPEITNLFIEEIDISRTPKQIDIDEEAHTTIDIEEESPTTPRYNVNFASEEVDIASNTSNFDDQVPGISTENVETTLSLQNSIDQIAVISTDNVENSKEQIAVVATDIIGTTPNIEKSTDQIASENTTLNIETSEDKASAIATENVDTISNIEVTAGTVTASTENNSTPNIREQTAAVGTENLDTIPNIENSKDKSSEIVTETISHVEVSEDVSSKTIDLTENDNGVDEATSIAPQTTSQEKIGHTRRITDETLSEEEVTTNKAMHTNPYSKFTYDDPAIISDVAPDATTEIDMASFDTAKLVNFDSTEAITIPNKDIDKQVNDILGHIEEEVEVIRELEEMKKVEILEDSKEANKKIEEIISRDDTKSFPEGETDVSQKANVVGIGSNDIGEDIEDTPNKSESVELVKPIEKNRSSKIMKTDDSSIEESQTLGTVEVEMATTDKATSDGVNEEVTMSSTSQDGTLKVQNMLIENTTVVKNNNNAGSEPTEQEAISIVHANTNDAFAVDQKTIDGTDVEQKKIEDTSVTHQESSKSVEDKHIADQTDDDVAKTDIIKIGNTGSDDDVANKPTTENYLDASTESIKIDSDLTKQTTTTFEERLIEEVNTVEDDSTDEVVDVAATIIDNNKGTVEDVGDSNGHVDEPIGFAFENITIVGNTSHDNAGDMVVTSDKTSSKTTSASYETNISLSNTTDQTTNKTKSEDNSNKVVNVTTTIALNETDVDNYEDASTEVDYDCTEEETDGSADQLNDNLQNKTDTAVGETEADNKDTVDAKDITNASADVKTIAQIDEQANVNADDKLATKGDDTTNGEADNNTNLEEAEVATDVKTSGVAGDNTNPENGETPNIAADDKLSTNIDRVDTNIDDENIDDTRSQDEIVEDTKEALQEIMDIISGSTSREVISTSPEITSNTPKVTPKVTNNKLNRRLFIKPTILPPIDEVLDDLTTTVYRKFVITSSPETEAAVHTWEFDFGTKEFKSIDSLEKEIDEDLKELDLLSGQDNSTEEEDFEGINGVVKDVYGDACFEAKLAVRININTTSIPIPSNASITGNCSENVHRVMLSWISDDAENFNNTLSFIVIMDDGYNYISSMDLKIFDPLGEDFISQTKELDAKTFLLGDDLEPKSESIVFDDGVIVEFVSSSFTAGLNGIGDPTLIKSMTLFALQIASASACVLLILVVIGIMAYKKMRSKARIFKVSIDK